MEALACGTPVVAADIVEPRKTGFLVRSASEMAQAIAACDSLDRDQCWQQATPDSTPEK